MKRIAQPNTCALPERTGIHENRRSHLDLDLITYLVIPLSAEVHLRISLVVAAGRHTVPPEPAASTGGATSSPHLVYAKTHFHLGLAKCCDALRVSVDVRTATILAVEDSTASTEAHCDQI